MARLGCGVRGQSARGATAFPGLRWAGVSPGQSAGDVPQTGLCQRPPNWRDLVPCLWVGLLLLALACGRTDKRTAEELAAGMAPGAVATAYTTRLPAATAEEQAIAVSQAVYGATREENSPGAIILSPQSAPLAFTAMHRITHMPVNAPLLYLDEQGRLSSMTQLEMKRLKPEGVTQDGQVQVYIVGAVAPAVVRTVREQLGYKVRQFPETDPIRLAELLDRWQAAFKADHPDEVVISALDHPEGLAYGMGAMGWNAHMGKGFAWVLTDRIPEQTRRILDRRFGRHGAYIYLTGGPEVISDAVARDLGRYGLVRRIQGPNVYAANATNAGYKDYGRDFGWWWGWTTRSFGWGIAQAGHNFIINSAENLLGAIPSALLGHMGKHGPLLLVRRDEVPAAVADYLRMVQPFVANPTKTIRNHAWIIGDESTLSWALQQQIHQLLTPKGLQPDEPR